MQNFDYMTPTRLIFGKGAVEKLADAIRPYGKRVLLAYGGGSIKKSGLYDKVKALLADCDIFELSGIQPNPKYDPSVLEGVKICKEQKIDIVLAVGGGSVLDLVKYVGTQLDKPYITMPSALSNDAIYSCVARLTYNHKKKSSLVVKILI